MAPTVLFRVDGVLLGHHDIDYSARLFAFAFYQGLGVTAPIELQLPFRDVL